MASDDDRSSQLAPSDRDGEEEVGAEEGLSHADDGHATAEADTLHDGSASAQEGVHEAEEGEEGSEDDGDDASSFFSNTTGTEAYASMRAGTAQSTTPSALQDTAAESASQGAPASHPSSRSLAASDTTLSTSTASKHTSRAATAEANTSRAATPTTAATEQASPPPTQPPTFSEQPTPAATPAPAAPAAPATQQPAPAPAASEAPIFRPLPGSAPASAGAAGTEDDEASVGPRYQRPTQVLPKAPLQEYANADTEHISSVFSTGTALGRGIRSLPDAFSPDFRQKLYEEMLQAGRREKNGTSKPAAPPLAVLPLAPGQRQVPKVHPYSGTFTSYEYMPSEYDRKTIISKFERLKNKLQQVTPAEFVVKAPPLGPRGAPAFSEFEYDLDPFSNADTARSADAYAARLNLLSGPFLAGGKIDSSVNLRGLADECMLALCKQLSTDWPAAFLQVFEDSSGAIVLCFDKVQAVSEGDLSSYMQNQVKTGRVAAEFKLTKDAAQWGLMDDETMSCFFVLWPPWVRHRFLGATKTTPTAGAQTYLKQ